MQFGVLRDRCEEPDSGHHTGDGDCDTGAQLAVVDEGLQQAGASEHAKSGVDRDAVRS